ncbi:Protein of unknown function [Paenibacillus sp. 1_12]|uniref:DUF3992 domain-containing protein n=1 Tax=Paenibacillus sp. 1_12 TaxID=1566278 RepID=UPI0008EA8AFC|nr:S-Ena type endospore appendage [Paenibacillus sp. 1_12]SFK81202.1 Protein of unknown function [Paenibacillus sp. 1_12]
MSFNRDLMNCDPKHGLVQNCIEFPWFVHDSEVTMLYTTNEVISAYGTVSSDVGSTHQVQVQFLFRQVVVKSFVLTGGQTVAFAVTGFDGIQIVGSEGANASGNCCCRYGFNHF